MARDIVIIPNRDFTGSTTHPEIRFSGLTGASITLKVEDDGTVVFEGDTGGLFEINDSKDGLLSAVSDVSGLPILAVYSDDRVVAGKWDDPGLTVSGNTVFIGPTGVTTSSLHVSGTTTFLNDTDIINGGAILSGGTDLYSIFSTGGSDGNGIYDGSGTVPSSTVVDIADTISFSGGTVLVEGASNTQMQLIGIGATSSTRALRLDNSGGVMWDFRDDEILYKGNGRFIQEAGSSTSLFIGRNAGNTSTTANQNIAIGPSSLVSVTTASQNTVLGYAAGFNITSQGLNTAVGSFAGYLMTGQTNTAIGASAGYYIKGNSNTAVGYASLFGSASPASTGFENVAVGYFAGNKTTSGQRNVSVGSSAGRSITSGNRNVSIGYRAGYNITGSSNNVAVGTYAIEDSDSASNTAVGYSAMRNVGPGGNDNTAIGFRALEGSNANKLIGLYNVSIGGNSMQVVESGATRNTAIGYFAGQSITDGTNNVCLGIQAGLDFGKKISGGTYNILIGPDTRVIEDNPNNYLAIGKSSEPTITGDIANKEIGIGLSTGALPNSTLEVGGSLALKVLTASTNTNTANEVFVGITDTSSPRTVTIQSADIVEGRIFVIKDQSGGAGTNNITIATQGSETIDGSSTITITSNYGVGRLYASNDGNLYTW
jgi:hypothetical protein